MLYLYGDCGEGPQNERKVTWESMEIPTLRSCERLHVSLAWMGIGRVRPVCWRSSVMSAIALRTASCGELIATACPLIRIEPVGAGVIPKMV